ncbi:MAG TPA: PQQ-binding-like beta-propeller repeat protein [Pirellulales bacterium]|jgi:outer membrane protein assembly factor BamB|nr:PQQ-binding-like beta-propeller repeat protein [Pirellulales bacterium]
MPGVLSSLLVGVTISWAAICSAEQTDAWPRFRGPHGDGHSSATGLPLEWSETKNVRWKTAVPGKAWSSPVVWGDQIWFTNATAEGDKRSAVCVDLASGKIVHEKRLLTIENPQFAHEMNSHASPTPVIEPGRVYVHFGSTGTFCLDTATAEPIWSRLDLPCDHWRGPASSPILFENLLVVAYDGYDYQYVVALDKRTGKTVWKRDRNIQYRIDNGDVKKAYGTCAVIDVNGQPQLIAPSAEATIAYNSRTGDEIWRVRHGGMNVSATPLYADGRLILNTGAGGMKMLAVDPRGKGDVTDTHILWKYEKVVPTRSSPVLVGKLLFMVNDSGIASCVDVETAKQVWQTRFGGDFSASPIFADGRIYFFDQEGRSPVIAPATKYELLADNQLGDGFMASPAVVGKALILRSRSHLYRVELPD